MQLDRTTWETLSLKDNKFVFTFYSNELIILNYLEEFHNK